MKHRNKKSAVLNIVSIVLLALAHIAVAVFAILSRRYYELSLDLVLSLLGIIVCVLLILDVIFFVGANHHDTILRSVVLALSALLLIAGIVGSAYIIRINKSVDNLIDDETEEMYETIYGSFVSYDKSYASLSELEGKKVGVLNESSVGASSIGQQLMEKEGVTATYIPYNTMDDMLSGLVEDVIDAAIFPASYRQRFTSDDQVDYSAYVEKLVEFKSFEEQIQTSDAAAAKKDLSTEPFNILLIGFAPENEAGTYGLADSIIIATVNPKMMTVGMTSIARDSLVPISCYGGAEDKINAARGTSRACLIETVEDLVDIDIDYYMEVNFQGVVDIVDAIGGVVINSPIEFVGQSASGNRGEYVVWVPKGEYKANGQQALAFARERKRMPNGDFDRQIHQQQVIYGIASAMIESGDINVALNALEAAGNNFSTNLSLSQMTNVFNYIINIKNYSAMPLTKVIDIQSGRVTGIDSWTYNYSMRLPLWCYRLYNGALEDAKTHIDFLMQKTSISPSDQQSGQNFHVWWPYYRDSYIKEWYDETVYVPPMPDYVPTLEGYTYEQAIARCAEKNCKLNPTFIGPDDPGYDAGSLGLVLSQYPRMGALVEEYPVVDVTVMGDFRSTTVDCKTVEACKLFAEENAAGYELIEAEGVLGIDEIGDLVKTEPKNGEEITGMDTMKIYYVTKLVEPVCGQVEIMLSEGGTVNIVQQPAPSNACKFIVSATPNEGYGFDGWVQGAAEGSTIDSANVVIQAGFHKHNFTVSAHVDPTCDTDGYDTYTCSVCGASYDVAISATGGCEVTPEPTPETPQDQGGQ